MFNTNNLTVSTFDLKVSEFYRSIGLTELADLFYACYLELEPFINSERDEFNFNSESIGVIKKHYKVIADIMYSNIPEDHKETHLELYFQVKGLLDALKDTDLTVDLGNVQLS